MSIEGITIDRSQYVVDRLRELIVKTLIRRAAKRREGFGRFAAIPTDFVGMNVIANGFYERHELTILRRLIESQNLSETTALDIGANIGNHAVVFSKLFRDVIAFEPNPSVAALLEANIVLSGSKNNVDVRRVGLGPKMPFCHSHPIRMAMMATALSPFRGGNTIDLPVRNGDQLLSEIDPDIATGKRRIGFIKCDVEGFEKFVFAGLRHTLENHSPIVVYESDENGPGAEAFAILQQCGYKYLYAIRETGDHLGSRLQREIKRLTSRYQFWLEPFDKSPTFWTNVVVSKHPLEANPS